MDDDLDWNHASWRSTRSMQTGFGPAWRRCSWQGLRLGTDSPAQDKRGCCQTPISKDRSTRCGAAACCSIWTFGSEGTSLGQLPSVLEEALFSSTESTWPHLAEIYRGYGLRFGLSAGGWGHVFCCTGLEMLSLFAEGAAGVVISTSARAQRLFPGVLNSSEDMAQSMVDRMEWKDWKKWAEFLPCTGSLSTNRPEKTPAFGWKTRGPKSCNCKSERLIIPSLYSSFPHGPPTQLVTIDGEDSSFWMENERTEVLYKILTRYRFGRSPYY